MTKRFYSVSLLAETKDSFRSVAGWLTAINDDEANGVALRMCHTRYPIERGFYGHQADLYYIGQISDDGKTITTIFEEKFKKAAEQSPNH